MNQLDDSEFLRPRLRVMQIIAAALVAGATIFLGIALYLVFSQGKGLGPPRDTPLISLVAIAMLIANGTMSLLLPGAVARAGIRSIAASTWSPPQSMRAEQFASDEAKLLSVRQTSQLIGLALWEAVAFISGIAYLLEAQSYILVVAGLALLVMLANFPTAVRTQLWLERQLALVREMRESPGGPPSPI